MKKANKLLFPLLLIAACVVIHFWQHGVASLPYLPKNWIVRLITLTPALPVLTFLTTLVLLKQSETPRPVLRSWLSTGAMMVPVLALAVFFLSYLTYRFAAALPPLLVLPDWPSGIVTMIITVLCLLHLTGLLICRFVKQKAGLRQILPAALGWLVLNGCLFLVTT